MNRKLDFLIIGAQKAGTTSVYDWISQHPDVYAPQHLKDFPFFRGDKLYHKGEEFLHKQIGKIGDNKKIGAGSVQYLFFENIPERIYNYNKNIKLIAILREPIERAISAYRYAVERGLEHRTFSQAIHDEIKYGDHAYTDYKEANQKFYLKRGLYYQQLENYYKYFPKDQILVLFFEELKENKEQIIFKIFNFLNIKPYYKINYNTKNITNNSRDSIIYKILYSNQIKSFFLINFFKRFIPLKLKHSIAQFLIKISRKTKKHSIKQNNKVVLNTKDYELLNKYFEEDIKNLNGIFDLTECNWLSNIEN